MANLRKPRKVFFVLSLGTATAALAIAFPLAVVATQPAQAQTFAVLHNFTGGQDGADPQSGVTDKAGILFGTTFSGGKGYGTVYQLKHRGSGWIINPLYDFAGGSDGANPVARVVFGPDGLLYGTTYYGGGSGCSGSGCGTVFRLRPPPTACTTAICPWTETVLYRFGGGDDGEQPTGDLIFDQAGNIYGTTYGNPAILGYGTVFKITPGGSLTTLYSFCSQSNCTDGADPYAGLVQGSDGNFYGTTVFGGANDTCGSSGCGTVFRITPSDTLTTLYSFCAQSDCADGELPFASLVQGSDGNFYGTTFTGTPSIGSYGTVFRITPSGTLTTLYTFCSQSNCTDGAAPHAGLVQASDGNFYGTTTYGGANDSCVEGGSEVGCGTLFKITPTGTVTTLYSLCSQTDCTDGQWPLGGLVQDTNGSFYGAANQGGANGDGTVFSLSVGLGRLVENTTSPTAAMGETGH